MLDALILPASIGLSYGSLTARFLSFVTQNDLRKQRQAVTNIDKQRKEQTKEMLARQSQSPSGAFGEPLHPPCKWWGKTRRALPFSGTPSRIAMTTSIAGTMTTLTEAVTTHSGPIALLLETIYVASCLGDIGKCLVGILILVWLINAFRKNKRFS